MNTIGGSALVALALLPAVAGAQGVEPALLGRDSGTVVTEDGLFLVDEDNEWPLGDRRIIHSLVDGKDEELGFDVVRPYGDAIDGLSVRQLEAMMREVEREQAPRIARDRKRWREFQARHREAAFGEPGAWSPHGWAVRVTAPGCGLRDAYEAKGGTLLASPCHEGGAVQLDLVRGTEVHPWRTGQVDRNDDLRLELRWSSDGQWIRVASNMRGGTGLGAAIPRVQVLAENPASRAAAVQQLERAGYRVAASGKSRDPHAASELYSLQPFEAEARRIAALLGVAAERVQPLTWEAPAPVVVVLVPGPAPSPPAP